MSGKPGIHVFAWTGCRAADGAKLKGVMQAGTRMQVQKQLWQRGVIAVAIRRQRSVVRWRRGGDGGQIYASLSVLMGAGIPLAEALGLLRDTLKPGVLRDALSAVQSGIESGQALAVAMARYPACFPLFYTRLIHLGEETGVLEEVLARLAEHHDRMGSLRGRMRQALLYPVTVIGVAVLVMLVMLLAVVPQFATVFAGMDAELPAMTQGLLTFSSMLREYAGWVVSGLMLMLVSLRWLLGHCMALRWWLQGRLLCVPLLGGLWRLDLTVRFCRHLALLLHAGVPMVEALRALAPVMGHQAVTLMLEQLAARMGAGLSLQETLQQGLDWPLCALTQSMMIMGERSGNLEMLLLRAAACHEKELNGRVDMLGVMLEPLLMLVLGLAMGWFIMALYLPVFGMGAIF